MATRHDLCRATWHRIRAGEGFLYAAEAVGSGLIKLGFSVNPKQRMRSLYGQLPLGTKPRLLAAVPYTLQQEQALHRELIEHQAHPYRAEVYPRSILSHPAIPAELRSAA